MPFRIEIQSVLKDARGKVKKKQFEALGLKNKIGAVYVLDCYTIDAKLDKKQIQKAAELLANPLVEKATIVLSSTPHPASSHPLPQGEGQRKFDFAIEISFLPGVTDNVGSTAKETLEDGLKTMPRTATRSGSGTGVKFKDWQRVYSSQVYLIKFSSPSPNPSPQGRGRIKESGRENLLADAAKIADSLYNPLIQKATVKSYAEFTRGGGFGFNLPKVRLTSSQKVITVDLNVPDKELKELGKLGIPEIFHPHPHPLPSRERGYIARRGPLSLDLDALKAIRNYFNKLTKPRTVTRSGSGTGDRKPTDVELESLAQTWSEHCKHTIFQSPIDSIKKGLFKHYIQRATEIIRKKKSNRDFCVSVFKDNSGGIVFDDHYLITHKVETHNTPSALDPFGGAITGIVGVNRDCLGFGLGAKPVVNVYGFCFAPPDDQTILYRDAAKLNRMLSAKRIMEGVIAGVNAGGNQSGIPTNSGFLYFDRRFRGKPLVFCGTVGLIPRAINGRLGHIKQAQDGDFIVMVGGRVGLDGIHGATFSSESLDTHSPATAVQIGDPITQKKLSDAITKEARERNLYNSITDCGAGGLSSAVGEMARESGGCEVQLDKVPVKYPGLAPWQIWISESQERMVLALPQKKWRAFEKLMRHRGVEATIIGHFTNSGKCLVKFKNQIVMDVDLDFLHNGMPKKQLFTSPPQEGELVGVIVNAKDKQNLLRPPLTPPCLPTRQAHEEGDNFNSQILNLLSRPNLANFEFISQQYDHEVQGGSVLKPLEGRGRVNSSATITKPILNSLKGVVLSSALFPSYCEIDPYKMAACAIDTAIRNAVATGANVDYLALLDNFCWCSSSDPKRLWQLKQTAKACFDYAVKFGTPFISGKDSMFNDFQGFNEQGKPIKISIPPTLLISAIGVVPDVTKTVSLDVKMPGDLIYILGETNDELGGNEYLQMISTLPSPGVGEGLKERSKTYGTIPKVNALKNLKLYRCLFQAIQKNLVASAISIGRGGLAIALSKMLMGGYLGAKISLQNLPGKWKESYQALFSESMGRILISVDKKKASKFEKLMSAKGGSASGGEGNALANLGKITNQKQLVIKDKSNKTIVNIKIASALKAYKSTFASY